MTSSQPNPVLHTAVLEKEDEESPALVNARKAHETLTREQRGVLAKTLNEFVNALSSTGAKNILNEASWFNRVSWGDEDWEAWETWGWYRHFCRLVSLFSRVSPPSPQHKSCQHATKILSLTFNLPSITVCTLPPR